MLRRPTAPDKVVLVRADATRLAWVEARGADLVAFASPLARTAGDVKPSQLGVLTGGTKSGWGTESATLGPSHFAVGADLFPLGGGQGSALRALALAPSESVDVVGLTDVHVYWLTGTHGVLRRMPLETVATPAR